MSDVVEISRQKLIYEETIGEGGFSTVYRMLWKSSEGDIKVAAKRLNKIDRQELNILVKLRHAHIVQLLGVVDEPTDFMLILELSEAGSLRSYLDRQYGRLLSTSHLLEWAEQTALPIQYLKQKGIVHKDIKASNYLIAKQNVLKLADFGLAKHLDKTQSNATGRGTYGWMAPELLIDDLFSPTFDIYAYGITLWELVTTLIPYHDLGYPAVVYEVCHNKSRPPIPTDCRQDLAELMKQCWHHDRKQRPTIEHILAVVVKAKHQFLQRHRSRSSISSESDQEGPSQCEDNSAQIPSVWVMEAQFGQRAKGKKCYSCGLAINPISGDILVADRNSAQVNVFTQNGFIRYHLDTMRDLKPGEKSRPCGVAVSPDGKKYFITDGTCSVKVFGRDGLYKHHFATKTFEKSSATLDAPHLGGLAIDTKGSLLVGVTNKKYISVHATDDTNNYKGCIKLPIEPWNLAVTSTNDIVVSSHQSRSVQIVDHLGNHLATLNPPVSINQWLPYGVCCANDGHIYVCNWATSGNKGVHCYAMFPSSSTRLNYSCFAVPTDSYSPLDVILADNSSKLMVSGGDTGVRIYLKR